MSPLLGSAGRKLLNALRRKGGQTEERPQRFDLAYAILVSEELHNHMRRLQVGMLREYGASSGIEVSPHITLKQAFEVPEIEPFERHFDRLVAEMDPFEITVRGVGAFDDGVIFMDVAKNRSLDALRQRVIRDLSTEFGVKPNDLEDDRYHFHATLAKGLPPASLERARRALEGKPIEFRFLCHTLALLCHTGTGWIIYKRSAVVRVKPHPAQP